MIKQRNLHRPDTTKGYSLIGFATTEANYLALERRSEAVEGDCWYDTTNNILKTYDGTDWSAAGLSSTSTGGLNNACSIGSTLTIDGSINTTGITVTGTTVASGALLLLDNDDTSNDPVCLNIDNEADASTAVSIQIDGVAGYDVQGTSDTWHVDYQGNALFHDVWVKDGLGVQFGTASSSAGDVEIMFTDGNVGTHAKGLRFIAYTSDEQICFGDATRSFDVWFCGDTATTNNMIWDINGGENSVGALVFANADIDLGDNDQIRLGGSQDFTIDYDSNNLLIVPAATNDGVIFGADGTGVTVTTYSATASRYMEYASARERLNFYSDASSVDPTICLDDDLTICFGEGSNFGTTGTGDAQLGFDGTNFVLTATAADTPFKIGGTSAGFDTTYYFKTAGTITLDWDGPADGNTAGLIIEGGADTMAIQIMDNDYLLFGDDATHGGTSDATLRWDSSAAELEVVGKTHFEDDVVIGTVTTDEETLTVYGDVTITGSLTHTGAYAPGALSLNDNEAMTFGTDDDFTLDYDSSTGHLWIEASTANTEFSLGEATNFDLKICCATATDYFLFDTDDSASRLDCVDTAIRFSDGTDILTFGPMASNKFPIESNTEDGHQIMIGETSAIDVMIHGATATNYVLFNVDDSALDVDLDGFALVLRDASSSMTIGPNASNILPIDGGAANDTISFGPTTKVDVLFKGTYDMQWDNSRNHLLFNDNAKLAFGGSASSTADYTISTAGSTSALILVAGTANDAFQIGDKTTGTDFIWQCSGNTNAKVIFDASADTNKGLVSFGIDDYGMDVKFFGDAAGEYVMWDQSADALQHGDGTATFSWTMEGNALQLAGDTDGRQFIVGSANETDFRWAAGDANTNTFVLFDASDDTGVGLVEFGQDDYGVDVKFYGATSSDSLHWDQSADALIHADQTASCSWTMESGKLRLTPSADDGGLEIGSGTIRSDIKWFAGDADATATVIFDASADNSVGAVYYGVDDHGIDVKFYGATSSESLMWDQSGNALVHADSTDSFSWTMESGSLRGTSTTADEGLEIGDGTTRTDFKWHAGSANTATVVFDASADTSQGSIIVGVDDLGIDVKFYGATSSETLMWDQSGDALVHSDSTASFSWTMEGGSLRGTSSAADEGLEIGDGTTRTDFKWHAGSANTATVLFDASTDTSNGSIIIGADDLGIDVTFYGATSSENLMWDQSADALIHSDQTASFSWTMEGGSLRICSDTADEGLEVGDGTTRTDFKWFAGAGTSAYVLFDASADTSNGAVQFGADDHGVDVTFYGETSSETLTWDNSADALIHGDGTATFSWTMESNALRLTPDADNRVLELGSGTIMTDIKWWGGDADTAGFVHFDASDDTSVGSVSFGQDDHGIDVYFYGATTALAMQWDQSSNSLLVKDNTTIDLGATTASPDQEITPDGTNVDWTINSGILTIGDGGTSNYAQFATDGLLTLNGTAQVTKNVQLPIQTGGGTVTVSVITGAPSIDFNADGEIVYLSFQVPNDWNASSDMNLNALVQNEIAEDDGDDIEIIWTVHGVSDGGTGADAGQTVTHALNLTGGDQGINLINEVTAVIDYDHGTYDIAAGDTVILKGIVSLAAGTECTGPLHILDVWVEYTANSLGTAT